MYQRKKIMDIIKPDNKNFQSNKKMILLGCYEKIA